MDAGPVFAQESIGLTGDENKFEIYEKLAQIGATMLLNNLPRILSGELTPTPQNEADATYCQMLTKADGNLNPDTLTATDCDRKIRAYLGFPKTRLNLLGSKVIVTKAKVLDKFNGDDWPDVIKCADNSYLQIKEIVSPNSGKTMPVADYLRGVKA
jgi:methionyl-tRNA formyltransferase